MSLRSKPKNFTAKATLIMSESIALTQNRTGQMTNLQSEMINSKLEILNKYDSKSSGGEGPQTIGGMHSVRSLSNGS